MNPEIGSDPFLRPQVGHLNAARQAQAEAAAMRARQSAAVPARPTPALADPNPAALAPAGPEATTPAAARAFHQRGDEIGGRVGEIGPNEAKGDLSFDDLIDLVNPLQHIPVVSTLYREITGDDISAPAQVFGGLLYGGPVGFVSAMVNTIAREASGRDLGQLALDAVLGDGQDGPKVVAVPPEPKTPGINSLGTTSPETPSHATAPLETQPLATAAGPGAPVETGDPATKDRTSAIVPPPPAPPPAAGKPTASLTGKAALEALAADFGAGASLSEPNVPPNATGKESPVANPQSSDAGQPRVPTMPLRGRDWRGKGPEARPTVTALDAPGRLASRVVGQGSGLQALNTGALAPGMPSAGSPLPLEMLSQGTGLFPSAVAPQLLANSQEDDAFAGRMLEALGKYEKMKHQGQP